MKRFLALPALLRTAAILASASQQSFSVNDDLLAFPQYEIRLREKWISEDEAQARLLSKPGEAPAHDGDEDEDEDAVGHYQGSRTTDRNDGHGSESSRKFPVEYEYMVLGRQRWLCSVPLVTKPEEADAVNETLSRAEEEKELARATDRGWELLSGMKDDCVYFISGRWSYRFCYNKGVKQFHQLPPSRGVPSYPPMEDPGVEGYILGTYDKHMVDDDEVPPKEEWTGQSSLGKSEGTRRKRGGSGELVQRGESRYLVQHLGGGTVCDLTGKERSIDVQFHCSPKSGDKISLIKETTTCSYLMVIETPRLCNDVAFLPPQKDRPNPIMCSPILTENEIEGYEKDIASNKASEQEANIAEAKAAAAAALGGLVLEKGPALVGDIYVGGHAIIPEDQKIEKSAILGGGKETYIDTVASSDGKGISKQDLEKLGLGDAKSVEQLKKKLEKLAQGQAWKLDVVETARGREYRGIIGDDEDEDENAKEAKTQTQTQGKGKGKGGNEATNNDKQKTEKRPQQKTEKSGKKPGSEEGFYKEEL